MSVCLSVCLSVGGRGRRSVCLSVGLSVCLSVCLSVFLPVRVCVCLCTYLDAKYNTYFTYSQVAGLVVGKKGVKINQIKQRSRAQVN